MRIALLAPLISPIAPPFQGGAQALLSDLATGLAARGHDVTLYAADGSSVPAVRTVTLGIDPATLTPARFANDGRTQASEDDDTALYRAAYAFMAAYRVIARHAGEHDLLHAHAYDLPAYAYASQQPLPILHTLHLPNVDPAICDTLALLAPPNRPASGSITHLVTVSQACAATYTPYCRVDAVIYNGIDLASIPFRERPAAPAYLLYAGRMAPEKGVEDALEIAERAGRRLLLAGGIYDADYFEQRIRPRLAALGDRAEYLGLQPREHLYDLMAGAEALLVPSKWDEPFGIVASEAQAAGAPVIAYTRGGLTEVIADGVTGFLVPPDDISAAAAALARVPALDRAACRAHIERRFSLAAMLTAYEAFYAHTVATARAYFQQEPADGR
jgi:glycosyltransferase involved in cell wall biosynthesis